MTRTPFNDLPPAQQAGILCNDEAFQRFAAAHTPGPYDRFSEGAAAEFLRRRLDLTTRATLNSDREAQDKFQRLRTDFDEWRGRIAKQR